MVHDGSESPSFDEARAVKEKWSRDNAELDNRLVSCPRCHAAPSLPCLGRDEYGGRMELDYCHTQRANRRRDRW